MQVTTRFGLSDLLVVANTRHGPGGHHGARATHDGPDHDHLRDPQDARDFLVDHGIEAPEALPSDGDLRRMRALREAVRVRVERGVTSSAPTATRAGYRLGPDGELVSRSSGWASLTDDLRLPLVELSRLAIGADGLKICGNPLCRWLFADRSKNASRRWCDMAACGNRAKVARHRLQTRAG